MNNRITEKMLESKLQTFCKLTGTPYGHYKAKPGGGYEPIQGGLAFSHQLGGYQLEQIDSNGGTSVHCPLGYHRGPARDWFDRLDSAINALQNFTLTVGGQK